MFVLANVANHSMYQRSILADARLLSRLRSCLVDAKVEIRRPAVSCVLELVRANPRSHRALHDAGVDSTLRHMCEHAHGGGGGGHHHYHHPGGAGVGASPGGLRALVSGGRAMGAEDDPEVQDRARRALHWLEQHADAEG